jgi:hypothetical protein
MEGLQFIGVFAFIYGVLWASSMLRHARSAIAAEYHETLRRIERFTVMNGLGPLIPVVVGLGVVSFWGQHALVVAVAAITLTALLLALRGAVHARRMRGVGVPRAYRRSYRAAHAIRAVGLALCAATLVHPLLG